MKIADFRKLVAQLEKAGFRVAWDTLPDTDTRGLPPGYTGTDFLPDRDDKGVSLDEARELAEEVARIAPLKGWQHVRVVGPDLKPAIWTPREDMPPAAPVRVFRDDTEREALRKALAKYELDDLADSEEYTNDLLKKALEDAKHE